MRIISDKTGKEYSSVEECLKAEEAYEKEQAEVAAKVEAAKAERKQRAKEIEEAGNKYYELLNAFIKDYGSYHRTFNDIRLPSILDMFSLL